MKTVFVADAHLKGQGDPNQAALVKFLSNLKVDNLVMLGDIFDFWTGANMVVERNYSTVLDELLKLKGRGAHIFYVEGNHDFSMGPFFTSKLKARVIPDMGEASLDGKRFLLLHGDTVSMTFGYMLWRAFLRSPVFRVIAWAATPGLVWKCAMGLSRRSHTKNAGYDKGSRIDEGSAHSQGRGSVLLTAWYSRTPTRPAYTRKKTAFSRTQGASPRTGTISSTKKALSG